MTTTLSRPADGEGCTHRRGAGRLQRRRVQLGKGPVVDPGGADVPHIQAGVLW